MTTGAVGICPTVVALSAFLIALRATPDGGRPGLRGRWWDPKVLPTLS
jgi:hypothetical protein